MRDGDADELLPFERVRVLNVTSGAMHCLIGDKSVWLPREHIRGTLRCRGDIGRLLIRRWVAVDRNLPLPSQIVRVICDSFRIRQSNPLRLVWSVR
jgi:hypothetical protein